MKEKLQTNFDVIRLYDENNIIVEVTKVGILPFIPASSPKDWQVMVMKPKAEAKRLGPPAFQIAKGTRRIHINDNWCDMREDDLLYADASFYELIIDTALREGQEEVGLKPGNVKRLFDVGCYKFTSASGGHQKPIHMFAAEMADTKDFDPFEHTTDEVRWMTPEAFAKIGREDHVKIMQSVVELLTTKAGK